MPGKASKIPNSPPDTKLLLLLLHPSPNPHPTTLLHPTQTIYAHLEWWKRREIAGDGFQGNGWYIHLSLSVRNYMFATSTRLWNEVIKQCYVYGLAPCLQLLWFCLSDERKSKFVLMKPESRYCWFRGMHKLQLDNARCFTASCRGVITVVSRMRVLERGGRGGRCPLFCRRPPPPGHSQSVIKNRWQCIRHVCPDNAPLIDGLAWLSW